MYPGKDFSPQTQLTSAIGATDTVISVDDITVFPPAPNRATIGLDEYGEEIIYAAIAGNTLSGCTRGISGTAKSWTTGEIIGRYYTNKDHQAFIDNINDKAPAIHADQHHTGGTDALSASDIGAAPISHASTTATYGLGSETKYGHIKLSDAIDSISGVTTATAATPQAVKKAYDLAQTKASTVSFTATISTTWSGTGPWTQAVNISGISSVDTPIIAPVLSTIQATRLAELESWGLITKATATINYITFIADEAMPSTAIPIQIQVVR